MAIVQEDVERVRQASDLIAVVSQHLALRKVGRRWVGLCPFHAEKSPSFSVNGEQGVYYCFGCQAKGDVITFVKELQHLGFVEAVERLASAAGIEIRYDSNAANQEHKHRAVLTDAMERAVEWYHDRLLKAPDASPARAYLRERGYDGEIVRRFKIGWAPEGWDELSRTLNLPEKVLKETGLGFVNKRGRRQDAFRGRVMFPIFDVAGAPVAFGGRVLPGGEGPKYKNSSETALYQKSRTLYALNWAKGEVVKAQEVIVCEGYTDVIGFFQAGVPRAVATCGTALTEDHVRQLKNFATRMVLAYDADTAGQAAAERFYEWEKKFEIDIVVAVFPKGSDPADLARRDPSVLATTVDAAQPFLRFRIERALESSDLRTVEGRARAAERCTSMVLEHPNPLVRDQYLMVISDRCRIPVERLRQPGPISSRLREPEKRRGSEDFVVDVRPHIRKDNGVPTPEAAALRAAVNRPEELLAFLDRIAPQASVEGIEDVLFSDHRACSAFRALGESRTLHEALANAEPEASELLSQISVEADDDSAAQGEFLRLIERAGQRYVKELEVQARIDPGGLVSAGTSVSWLKLSLERLHEPETEMDAASDIVAWLLERPPVGAPDRGSKGASGADNG